MSFSPYKVPLLDLTIERVFHDNLQPINAVNVEPCSTLLNLLTCGYAYVLVQTSLNPASVSCYFFKTWGINFFWGQQLF